MSIGQDAGEPAPLGDFLVKDSPHVAVVVHEWLPVDREHISHEMLKPGTSQQHVAAVKAVVIFDEQEVRPVPTELGDDSGPVVKRNPVNVVGRHVRADFFDGND